MDDYIIIERDSSADLATSVNGWMGRGYRCIGGVSVSGWTTNNSGHGRVYAQAMEKKA